MSGYRVEELIVMIRILGQFINAVKDQNIFKIRVLFCLFLKVSTDHIWKNKVPQSYLQPTQGTIS